MKLLALVESPDHVCCRYRIRAFRPALERAGCSLTCEGLERRRPGARPPARGRGAVRRRDPPAQAPAGLAAPHPAPGRPARGLRLRRRGPLPRFERPARPRRLAAPPPVRRDDGGRRHRRRRQRLPGRLCPEVRGPGRGRPRDPDVRRPAALSGRTARTRAARGPRRARLDRLIEHAAGVGAAPSHLEARWLRRCRGSGSV